MFNNDENVKKKKDEIDNNQEKILKLINNDFLIQ